MPEWFEGLEPQALEVATARGWNKPAGEIIGDVFKSYGEAAKFVGASPNEIFRYPKDMTDPSFQGIFDRVVGMTLPKDAAEYKFDGIVFKDGQALDDVDQAFVRDFAAQHKVPVATARALATALVQRTQTDLDQLEASSNALKGAQDATLKGLWNTAYDQNAFAASKAVDALAALGIKIDTAAMPVQDYVSAMQGLVRLSAQLNEHAIVQGGGNPIDPTKGMTSEQATARFEELKQNRDWVTKALTPGTTEATELGNLQRAMALGQMAPGLQPR